MKYVTKILTNDQAHYFNWLVVVIGGIGGFLGGWDELSNLLVFMVVADYVIGVLAAVFNKNLNSDIMYWGIIRKVAMFVMVAVVVQIQQFVPASLPLRSVVLWFYIGKEGLSFLENIGKIIEYPPVIRDFFEQLKDKGNTKVKKERNEPDE